MKIDQAMSSERQMPAKEFDFYLMHDYCMKEIIGANILSAVFTPES